MNAKNQYLLMFNGKVWWNELSASEIQKICAESKAWLDGLFAQGKVKGAQALAREGATLAGKGGRILSDGPFAESKEAIGGYLLIEAESIDEVIALAKQSPALAYGTTIDIRPLTDECPLDARLRELTGQEQLEPAHA